MSAAGDQDIWWPLTTTCTHCVPKNRYFLSSPQKNGVRPSTVQHSRTISHLAWLSHFWWYWSSGHSRGNKWLRLYLVFSHKSSACLLPGRMFNTEMGVLIFYIFFFFKNTVIQLLCVSPVVFFAALVQSEKGEKYRLLSANTNRPRPSLQVWSL